MLGSTGFALLFCVAVFLGRLTVMDGTSLSLVWPAAGVATLWFALRRGAGTVVLDLVLLSAVTFAVNLWTGAPAVLAACFVAANVVQVLVFHHLFARWAPGAWGAGGRGPLTGVRALGALSAAALLATAAGATIGPTSVWALTGYWSWVTAGVWMIRNTVSVVLILTVGLRVGYLVSAHRRRAGDVAGPALPFRRPCGWGAVELVVVLVCSGAAYALAFGLLQGLPVAFPLLALTVWVALRFDTTIVVVHDFAVGVVAVTLTLMGHGPFAAIADDSTRALVVQVFVGMVAVLGLALALGRDERDVLLARMAASAAVSERLAAEAAEHRVLAEEQRDLAELAMAEAEAREAALAEAHAELAERSAELAERSAELERSNAELAQFAGVASHDLNSPLTVIAGYVEMLGEVYGEALGEQGRDWVATALKGTTRMKELIEALLAYSGAGSARCRRERTDLRTVFDQAVLDLQAAIGAAGAQVRATSLPVLHGDPVLLRQLLQNLIANAVKYRSPQRPCQVGVSATPGADGWAVAVADNGIGIPPEQREAVFAMFAQVDPTARSGHGIGLATCQRIVERHGGRIWVEETPGGGTTVRFTLPQRTATGPAGHATRPAPGTASLN
ncbi:ATP-binding protein [Kineococcus glutinatus]|uniref:Sensor-like histidine kinase SenX3 n=1 Tax=Kineococcus glutinatus TaxID=1070872 RepID=A0ABP9H312_9ACTN